MFNNLVKIIAATSILVSIGANKSFAQDMDVFEYCMYCIYDYDCEDYKECEKLLNGN